MQGKCRFRRVASFVRFIYNVRHWGEIGKKRKIPPMFNTNNHKKMDKDKQTAKALVNGQVLKISDIARLFLELIEKSEADGINDRKQLIAHCRRVIQLGIEAKKKEEQTVSFREAYEETLRLKSHRSKFTLRDIRYYIRKLMREIPGLADRPIRSISVNECHDMLEKVYTALPQRKKARAILSGVFNVAKRRQWCDHNPVSQVEIPVVIEREIIPLNLQETKKLLKTATLHPFHHCLAPVGLMLFAGIRPEELRRLNWSNIDLEEREISIPPTHSKTGGGRQIIIYEPLYKLLINEVPKNLDTPICPKQWPRLWSSLRRRAGFKHWQKDVLRHTFASFHVKTFKNLPLLQLLMGHRDSRLLRTRYVNLKGISNRDAQQFWKILP